MRKPFILLLILISLLVGCGSGQTDGAVELDVALWDPDVSEAVAKSVQAFEEKHPDVNVNVTYTPYNDYFTRLRTSLAGKKGPDVFWMNGPNFYQYASLGLIKNLQPLIERDNLDTSVYTPALKELYAYDQKLYGLPYFQDVIGLFFNKKLFDEAGIPYPDETWTWETVEEVGRKLTDNKNGIYGYIAPYSNQQGYYNYIHQAGGYVINEDKTLSGFDAPEAKSAFKWMKRMMDEGISPTAKTQIESGINQIFGSGKAAMLPQISVNAPVLYDMLGEDLGVAPLPKGKERATIIHGLSWVMNSNTKSEKLAWELLKTLSNKQSEQWLAETGFSIPAYRGTEDAWIESIPSVNLQVFIDSLEFGVPYPVSENTTKWQDVENEEIQKMLLGQTSIDEATEVVAEKMNEILADQSKGP